MYGGPPHASIPCRPPGVEPAGRLRGSGFAERQWLVRRGRQFVQVGNLLYRLVELVDGERTHEDIARELTESTRWHVTSEDVEVILKTRLAPLGLVVDEEAGVARPPMGGSPLLRNARLRVLGPGPIDHVARILQHLYRWPALLAALLVIGITQFWLFAEGDPNEAVQQVIATPLSLPLIAGLLLVAGVFHEFGHAAALRFGGGGARSMGAGVYLFIPVFYTDLTESYRLGRAARVRTDLGGLYLHLLSAAALIAAGAATGNPFFLVAAFLIDLDVARQLIPFIRLDGYWLLADLTGIPDLFAHAGARIRRHFRGSSGGPASPPLRRGVGRVFAAYIALAVPAIAALMAYVAWHAPSILDRTIAAVSARVNLVEATAAIGDWKHALLAAIEVVLLALPSIGLLFFFVVLGRAAVRLIWRQRRAASPSARTLEERAPAPSGDAGVSFAAAIEHHLELRRRRSQPDHAAIAHHVSVS